MPDISLEILDLIFFKMKIKKIKKIKNPFSFHYRQDEASKMPDISLEIPENIIFKMKIKF